MSELDLTRYVRTPEGAAYFHKPIGSPIGGGTTKKVERAVKQSVAKRAVTSARAEVSGTRAAKAFHNGVMELPEKERAEAVRSLREAIRGHRSALAGVDNKALLRIAADPRQHARIRAQAKKELAQRLQDTKKANRLHREAAKIAIQRGENPQHFLGVEGKGLSEFQKALIRLSPKYGNAMLRFTERVKRTKSYSKYAAGRHKATSLAKGQVKESAHVYRVTAVNAAAVAVVSPIISYVANLLGFDPNESIKHIIDTAVEMIP